MKIAIGTQIFLPYTQSWIYRQMMGSREDVVLVVCNEKENLKQFPFEHIVVAPSRSLWIRKLTYKLHFILKYIPFFVSHKKQKTYSHALKQYKIDIMHVHFGVMAVEFMQVCRKMDVPLLVTFHGYDITAAIQRDPSYERALNKLFQRMTLGIAISSEMKGRLISLGCSPEKIVVSYLGIPLEEFAYTDRTNHDGPVRLLHAGRLSATKGVPDLIRSFSAEFEQEDQVELLIVGDGEEKALVLQAIEASKVKDKIKFLGKLNNEELKHWRAKSDVFVLNCRTPVSGDKEGLPIALLEASCTGLPIISTKHSGIAEGVLDEQTGLLVEEYHQKALSQAMRRMMNKELRLQYGKRGRQLMEEQFDLVECNKVMDAIYRQAITTKKNNSIVE